MWDIFNTQESWFQEKYTRWHQNIPGLEIKKIPFIPENNVVHISFRFGHQLLWNSHLGNIYKWSQWIFLCFKRNTEILILNCFVDWSQEYAYYIPVQRDIPPPKTDTSFCCICVYHFDSYANHTYVYCLFLLLCKPELYLPLWHKFWQDQCLSAQYKINLWLPFWFK